MAVTHTITIITQDEQRVSFECNSDEDVISAGLRQDVILMSSCREGGCATCKGFCAEGDYQLVGCSVQALPPEEEEDGEVLLCRTFPETDLEVEVPYVYERIAFGREDLEFEAEVTALEPIASNTVRLQLKRLPNGSDDVKVDFASGQFMDLQIPGTEISRSFSPANISNKDGELEFLIRVLPDGKFSNYLRDDAAVGQTLAVVGPQGIFSMVNNGLQPRYFVAGGTGLAPIMSMVRHMHELAEPNQCTLYFGVNTEEEVFCLDELKQLQALMPNLTVRICVWHATDDWKGEKGTVVDSMKRDLESMKALPDFYLCGPPPMVDAVYAACEALNVPKETIHTEKFLPSGSQ